MLEPFGISEEIVNGLGKDPTRAVKMPSEFGDQYLASTEVVHQLHCLVCTVAFSTGSYLLTIV